MKEIDEVTGGSGGVCPMCRSEYKSFVQMPNPMDNAEKWFQLVDADASGNLTCEEIVDVVRATCNISEDSAEELIQGKLAKWDKDHSKGIEWNEFPGLLRFVFSNLPENALTSPPYMLAPGGKVAWFEYWDEDTSGALDKDEVARALIKTFGKNGVRTVGDCQVVISSIWPLFDPDASNTITKDEFLAKDGLADTVSACLLHKIQSLKSPRLDGTANTTATASP